MKQERQSIFEKFEDWIETAESGNSFVYHIGFLVRDRGYGLFTYEKDARQHSVDAMGDMAYGFYESGDVWLFQKRFAPCAWLYMAIRR